MHDVTVAFDGHDVGELDGAELGDAADVVTAQIDEHDVFSPFLWVGEEFLGQAGVFFLVCAAAACAGQGADGDLAIDHADHDLGRAADESDAGRAEVKHEGAGIDYAECAVDFEGMGVNGQLQALAGNHLEDIAGADVFHAFSHGVFKILLGEIGLVWDVHLAGDADVDGAEIAGPGG